MQPPGRADDSPRIDADTAPFHATAATPSGRRSGRPAWWGPQLLRLLYQMRLAKTGQLCRLLAAGPPKRVTDVLADLTAGGLIASVRVHGARAGSAKAWFLTDAGAELAETAGDVTARPYRMSPQVAAGPGQRHMLAVTEAACVFVEHARADGDDCSPLDWTVEVAHPTRDRAERAASGPASGLLITDAVLHYTTDHAPGREPVGGGVSCRRQFVFFVEVDRATMSVARLAGKVDHYARYYTYIPRPPKHPSPAPGAWRRHPVWRDRYAVFPKLLIILDGQPAERLEARIADLRAHCLANPRLTALTDELAMGVTTLTKLQARGPFAPIVHRLLDPDPQPVDVTMRERP